MSLQTCPTYVVYVGHYEIQVPSNNTKGATQDDANYGVLANYKVSNERSLMPQPYELLRMLNIYYIKFT